MRTRLQIWLGIGFSLVSFSALAVRKTPEVDASVALQLFVLAGGIAALLKKKNKR